MVPEISHVGGYIVNICIDPVLKEKGLKVAFKIIRNALIVNKDLDLEEDKKRFILSIDWEKINAAPLLQGYLHLYQDKSLIPPSLALLSIIKKNKRFPNINTVVDSYNLVSAKTLFSIGAHDLSQIKGNIRFVVLKGDEKYTPLGVDKTVPVPKSDYAAVDDEKVICYLDIKQCDQTKITKETEEFLVYVQGNENTSQNEVDSVLHEVIETIQRYCGGAVI